MVFADPPFNIGIPYESYSDNKTTQEYLQWTRSWLTAIKPILKPHGSIFVAISNQYQAAVRMIMEEVGFYWRDTIIWHYTFGPAQQSRFTPSWVAIHYATNHPRHYVFNADTIRVPSARQLKYKDKRANSSGKLPDNVWVLLPDQYERCFQPEQNVLLESRVCGTFKDRTTHPCQMPVAVLERLISVATHPGQMVLDPFLGSGTTAVACSHLNRSCTGIELSKEYIDTVILPRLQ